MNLFIVESISKCKKIKSYLNNTWDVQASSGHVSELPKNKLAIDLQTYEPEFVIMNDKKNLINQLKQKIKPNTNVYLAMDPDYEGERIAFELAKYLNVHNPIRITFNEITKEAILEAINNPNIINQNHVDAQTCRRVLDRLIGYQLSPVLRNITGIKTASVGRCISVVTKLIKEREEEIEHHKFNYTYKCYGNFLMNENLFKTILNKTFENKNDVINFMKKLKKFELKNVSEKQVKQSPPPPFITSSIQQEAYNNLGFSIKKTTKVLQDMYQNGWITYIRTDSTKIANSFHEHIKQYLEQKGNKYNYRTYRNSSHAQQAHECIRPTDLYRSMQEMNIDEKRLYGLIWKRTIASQMEDAIILKQTFEIHTNIKDFYFLGEQEEIINLGWKQLYINEIQKLKQLENPPLLQNIISQQTYNSPPKRYSQALLVKKLEQLGIGRPSTYSTIISSIESKNYVYQGDKSTPELEQEIIYYDGKQLKTQIEMISFQDKKRLIITELGRKFTEILDREFPEIMNYEFTSQIESEMDMIAQGQKDWRRVVFNFHNVFKDKLKNHQKDKIPRKQLGNYNGKPIEILTTRYGPAIKIGDKFWNISNPEEITFEKAMQIINDSNQYPKSLGFHNNSEIKLYKGPYGEYFKYNGKNYGLKYVKNITLDACIKIINKKD